jgi:hypothetical protein
MGTILAMEHCARMLIAHPAQQTSTVMVKLMLLTY